MEHILMMQYHPDDRQTVFLLEGGGEGRISETPLVLLDRWCMNNGSSLPGRTSSFRNLTGAVQKPAVLISERTQQLFFPLTGIRDPQCIWISYGDVLSQHSAGPDTVICFMDGSKIKVPFGQRLISGQMKRCRKFLEMINSERRFPYCDPEINTQNT